MAKRGKDTKTLSIIVNAVIVLWMAYCLFNIFYYGLEGNMTGDRFEALRYFTVDSNILAAVSALVMLVARITKPAPGSFATVFKYVGTVAVTITLVTVLVFLGPLHGYGKMLEGNNLYMHLVGPLLCIISFCWLDKGPRIIWGHVFKAFVPFLLYGIVYAVQVLVTKAWPDFYGFTIIKWYFSFVAMAAGTLVIAVILKALHNDK